MGFIIKHLVHFYKNTEIQEKSFNVVSIFGSRLKNDILISILR